MMIKKCAICGTEFETRYASKYCSAECRLISKREWLRNYAQTGKQRKVFNITCEICKKVFTSDRPQAKYCSDECRKKGNQIKNKRNQRLIHNWIEQEIPCEICQKPFTRFRNSKICPECREQEGLKKRQRTLAEKDITPDRKKVKTVRCTAQVMIRCYYGGHCAGLPCCDYLIKEPRLDKTESRLRGCPSWACDKYISKRAAKQILKNQQKSK